MTEDLLRRLELLHAQILGLAQTVADLVAQRQATETPAAMVPCPHPEGEQRDITTMGGPRRILCRACMTVLERPLAAKEEGSDGNADSPGL